MLKPKRKLNKKEVKEDKFVKTAMQAKSVVEENYNTVITVVIGVFAVIALISWLGMRASEKSEKASSLLGQAQLEFQNYNYSKARAFINRLMEEYDGSDAAAQGEFLLANLNYQDGKYDEAKENFKAFIDSYSGSEILMASGYAGYAACLEHEGDYAEAANQYEKAWSVAKDFVEAPNYLYLAGLNSISAGDSERAMELFNKILDDFPDAEIKNDAKTQLILIAGK